MHEETCELYCNQQITNGVELNARSSSTPLSISLYPDQGHWDPVWNTVLVNLKHHVESTYYSRNQYSDVFQLTYSTLVNIKGKPGKVK